MDTTDVGDHFPDEDFFSDVNNLFDNMVGDDSNASPTDAATATQRSSINRPPTPDQEEEEEEEGVGKEASLGDIINLKLVESGEKERLMELLRERLVECGWRDDMKALCRFGSSIRIQYNA
ncbi:Transcription and mRNA export factor SUS1 [Hordeum vulgare]|nr:Transcription and mRNA export factor SUS1 [Hordeum vulgare]